MTTTRLPGLPYPGISYATWWPGLDFYLVPPTGVADVVIGRSVEVDTAPVVTIQRVVLVGQCVETDTANQLFHTRFFPVGRSEEIDQSNLVLVLQPGLGLVTRYVTIELVDKNRRTRRDVHRDIITYSTSPTKVTFVHQAVTDKVRHPQHVDRIFFQKNL